MSNTAFAWTPKQSEALEAATDSRNQHKKSSDVMQGAATQAAHILSMGEYKEMMGAHADFQKRILPNLPSATQARAEYAQTHAPVLRFPDGADVTAEMTASGVAPTIPDTPSVVQQQPLKTGFFARLIRRLYGIK